MAESEAVRELQASLAQRRERADRSVAQVGQQPMQIPSATEVIESRPVKLALAHPALTGLAVGAIYFLGPLRLLRMATLAAGVLQSALSLRSTYEMIAASRPDEDPSG
jgi:hypothetical protein